VPPFELATHIQLRRSAPKPVNYSTPIYTSPRRFLQVRQETGEE
jgi:hypothetical protein